MKNKITAILLLIVVCLVSIVVVSAHGVDVTADKMIIADESNGVLAKKIADANGINISVYKFTSEDEVAHQLEHVLTNDDKQILVLTYQNIAKDFLTKHPEVSNRVIIEENVNNDTIKEGILKVTGDISDDKTTETNDNESSDSFILPLAAGLVVGIIIGLGCGVLLMKNKK